MSLKFKYNGRYIWHGVMITEDEEAEFACFADDMASAVATFDTLPDDAVVISLERGEDVGDEEMEVNNPNLEKTLAEHHKKQVN